MNLVGKDFKEMNSVLEGLKKGVEAQVSCELDLLVPRCGGAESVAGRDALQKGCLSSAEVIAESICLDGVHC
jgi:hypothetical protein